MSTGCGQSKKKAKHSAAKAMIDKLKSLSTSQDESGAISKVVADVPSLEVAEMVPYDDGINGNPVGKTEQQRLLFSSAVSYSCTHLNTVCQT